MGLTQEKKFKPKIYPHYGLKIYIDLSHSIRTTSPTPSHLFSGTSSSSSAPRGTA